MEINVKLALAIILSMFLTSNLFAQQDSEIKTKDLSNTNVSTNNVGAGNSQEITPEQMAELQNQMKTIKANQEKADKALEELDKE